MSDTPPLPQAAWWRAEIRGPQKVVWQLSPEVYALHGADPEGDLQGAALLRAGQGEQDDDLAEAARRGLADRGAFAHRRRLHRPGGDVEVLAVGMGEHDAEGRLTAISGCYVDLTATLAQSVSAEVTEQLAGIVQARAAIEQAKGALMLGLGISDAEAFALLGWYSQRTNTRVRDLAERVAAAAPCAPSDPALLDAHLAQAVDLRCAGLTLTPAPPRDDRVAPAVRTRTEEGHAVVELVGDVDIVTATTVVPQVRDALHVQPLRPSRLDVSGVGYLTPAAAVAVAGLVLRQRHQDPDLTVTPGVHEEALLAAGVPADRLLP